MPEQSRPIIDLEWLQFLSEAKEKSFLTRIEETQETYEALIAELIPEKSTGELKIDQERILSQRRLQNAKNAVQIALNTIHQARKATLDAIMSSFNNILFDIIYPLPSSGDRSFENYANIVLQFAVEIDGDKFDVTFDTCVREVTKEFKGMGHEQIVQDFFEKTLPKDTLNFLKTKTGKIILLFKGNREGTCHDLNTQLKQFLPNNLRDKNIVINAVKLYLKMNAIQYPDGIFEEFF